MGGVYKKIRKICVTKKKISSKLRNFFLKNQFFANFSKQIVFFYVKFAFRMFSAFIWYTYCPCRSKMTNFQKLWYRKLENFRGQSRLLRRHLTAKLCNLEWCSKSLQTDKDASFHLRWCLGWFAWKLSIQEHENCCGVIPPPPGHAIMKFRSRLDITSTLRLLPVPPKVHLWSILIILWCLCPLGVLKGVSIWV